MFFYISVSLNPMRGRADIHEATLDDLKSITEAYPIDYIQNGFIERIADGFHGFQLIL